MTSCYNSWLCAAASLFHWFCCSILRFSSALCSAYISRPYSICFCRSSLWRSLSFELLTAPAIVPVSRTFPWRTDKSVIHFAFRLSNFGKRLRKILMGLGYQIDFRAKNEVSILPLFAYYKAYFDSFGLTLYQNYLHTNLPFSSSSGFDCFLSFISSLYLKSKIATKC